MEALLPLACSLAQEVYPDQLRSDINAFPAWLPWLKPRSAFTIVRPESVRGSQVNSKVAVGLLGVGGRGSYDAAIFHADPRARVTALCDLFDDRIEKGMQQIKTDKPTVYKDYEKLLGAADLDAVIIASPPFEHPRMLEARRQRP